MPGLMVQGDMPDNTKEAAIQLLGEDENIHRNVLTALDVTQDERGLRNLIQAGCYRAAVNLSGRLISVYGQGFGKTNNTSKHTPHSLQLWFTRLALLIKLKQSEIAEEEARAFGDLDKPDMYFTFYPELYGTRHGSMASFSFRLLIAELPAYCGKAKSALNNLFKLLATIDKIIENFKNEITEDGMPKVTSKQLRDSAVKLWIARRCRVNISIINCALVLRNYSLAVDVLEQLQNGNHWTDEQIEILKSAVGRVHLFLGE